MKARQNFRLLMNTRNNNSPEDSGLSASPHPEWRNLLRLAGLEMIGALTPTLIKTIFCLEKLQYTYTNLSVFVNTKCSFHKMSKILDMAVQDWFSFFLSSRLQWTIVNEMERSLFYLTRPQRNSHAHSIHFPSFRDSLSVAEWRADSPSPAELRGLTEHKILHCKR